MQGPHALDNTPISTGLEEREQEEEEEEEDQIKVNPESIRSAPIVSHLKDQFLSETLENGPFFFAACSASYNCDLRGTGQLRPGDNAADTRAGQSNNLNPAVSLVARKSHARDFPPKDPRLCLGIANSFVGIGRAPKLLHLCL